MPSTSLDRVRKYRSKPDTRFKEAICNSKIKARMYGHEACTATHQEIADRFTGACEICGRSEEELGRRLQMDHCHATGKFRGWLCLRCNGVLGFIDTHGSKINAYLSPPGNGVPKWP